jgi:hypothetical protein
LSDALAVCLDVIALGATVDEALARFPRDAAELRPLLEASIRAREISAPAPSEEARIAARAAVLRAVAAKKAPVTITPHPAVRRRGWLALAPAALAAVVFAAIAVPLVGALDAGALPGDWNYGLKRAGERVQLALTTDPTDRRLLRLEFARRRLGEIEKLSQNGQVDGHASQVVSLVQDYTADITQVQSSVASAPAVDPSTKQAVDKTASDAQTVLQPIAQNATSSAAPVAQSALDAAAQTKQTADDKPSTTPATSPTQVAKATATATATSVQPEPAQALLPSATSAPPAAASATPAETATPTPTTTPAPAPTATPASPTVTATPPLRPAQDLPAVIATPAPSTTVAAATTFPLATGSPEPPAASTATPLPSPTGQPSTVVAAASVTSTPAANATPNATGVAAAASATFAPPSRTPAPAVGDATPAPVGTRPASALTPAPANAPIALQAGDNTVRYSGEPLPLDALLGPILSDVVFVDYADAAGLPHRWYPGTVAPAIGAANPVIIVRLRQPATVTLP